MLSYIYTEQPGRSFTRYQSQFIGNYNMNPTVTSAPTGALGIALIHKQLEMYRSIFSTVGIDALVLMGQAICIHSGV